MSRILVTGAAGGVGRQLLSELGAGAEAHEVLATDIAEPDALPGDIGFGSLDVRDADAVDHMFAEWRPEVVIHLASIVTPPPGSTRDFAYAVDVDGSRNVLDACLRRGVRRIVVTSSGAAYGYHADNPVPLRESDAVRGNREFAYSWHKRLVEEMLADARAVNPELEQVVLRVGTVLGNGIDNQITALFRRGRLLGVRGSDSPFVFIWTRDLARILLRAATDGPPGIYNVAGDSAMTTADLAAALGKPVRWLPPALLKLALAIARPLRLTGYGPEQVRFLQYRPVLDNTALKRDFGYTPEKTSAEAFEEWRQGAGL